MFNNNIIIELILVNHFVKLNKRFCDENQKTFSFILKAFFLLCLIVLQSITLSAQLRPRTHKDSIRAQKRGSWYNPNKVEFEIRYPKLQTLPPLTTDMPNEIIQSYIYLDSLLRTGLDNYIISRWQHERKFNDTIVAGMKYLYKIVDYNPIIFFQYGESQAHGFYKGNATTFRALSHDFVDKLITDNSKFFAMHILIESDYILKVHVNRIESPHLDRGLFNVHATVIDTLKGKVFSRTVNNSGTSSINSYDPSNEVTFTYGYGTYSNNYSHYVVDKSLLDATGNIVLKSGQDLFTSAA